LNQNQAFKNRFRYLYHPFTIDDFTSCVYRVRYVSK